MNSISTTFSPSTTRSGLWGWGTGRRAGFFGVLRRMAGLANSEAAMRDAVAEAADVRAMADSIRGSDPRFAADLYAAADRHERLYGAACDQESRTASARSAEIDR